MRLTTSVLITARGMNSVAFGFMR
jgi:hypothetical protein